MDRRSFLKSSMGAAALMGGTLRGIAAAAETAAGRRPNILWLIAEDFGQHLSCYGTKEVWTPNIDKLASDGVRFDRYFTVAPVCSPSRSAFMTGMYQITIGAHNHRSHRDDGYRLPEGVRVLPDWLRDAGYFTANLVNLPAPIEFKGTGKTDWNFTYGEGNQGAAYDTREWSELKAHQPFYAQLNFQETHRAFKAPKKADPAKVEFPPYYPDHPVTRQDWADYLDATSELDRKVGVVLKQLEADGLADDTIVIFFGDNGQAHVRGKQFCYEEGFLVPLIVRWAKNFPKPKGFELGKIDMRLLMSIDLAPTMLTIAGAKVPEKMEGKNFLGVGEAPLRQYVFGARDRCDETVFRMRSARDERYRYIRNFTPERPFLQKNDYKERSYPVWNLLKELNAQGKLTPVQAVLCAPTMPEEELYDMQNDPYEIKNLAKEEKYQDVLKRMRAATEEWIRATGDKGAVMEPADIVARVGMTKAESAGAGKKKKAGQGKAGKGKGKGKGGKKGKAQAGTPTTGQ